MSGKYKHNTGIRRKEKAASFCTLILLIASLLPGLISCSTEKSMENRGSKRYVKELGIQVLGIRETAAGYMLDLRYRVIDPERAASLLTKTSRPYLLHQKTGVRLVVPNTPKVGPLKSASNPEKNRNYFIMFGNPGKLVKSGDRVTVIIGDTRIRNLVVR